MQIINRLLHQWFPKRCSRDAPIIWINNEVRCPTCGRMLAYRFLNPKGTAYEVYICYNANLDEQRILESANADVIVLPVDPYGVKAALSIIHQRPMCPVAITIRKTKRRMKYKKRRLIFNE